MQWENPGVVDRDGAADTLPFVLFAEKTKGTSIFRVEYDSPKDSKSQVDSTEVLTPTFPWEAGDLGHPFPLRVGATVRLYYSAGGCIGLAESSDGVTFAKRGEPLVCDATAPLSAPGLVVLADGTMRLFATRGTDIVEASSPDGLSFGAFRVVLSASAPMGAMDDPDQPFDAAGVGDPHPLHEVGADGRDVTYLYFTGTNRAGATAVGLAARFESEGPLTRAAAPVLTRFDPRSPSVVRNGKITMLYVQGRSSEGNASSQGSILAGITPATSALP